MINDSIKKIYIEVLVDKVILYWDSQMRIYYPSSENSFTIGADCCPQDAIYLRYGIFK